MFKKFLVFALCISPLLVIEAGYPVKSFNETSDKGIAVTRRCFKVGELGEFARCFAKEKRVKGADLIADLSVKLGSLFPYFDVVFLGFIGLSFLMLFRLIDDST